MSQLTRFSRSIVRHLPSLNLVVRFDDSGIAVRAYRCRKWKSVTWAQLASLADDTEPVVRFCEMDQGTHETSGTQIVFEERHGSSYFSLETQSMFCVPADPATSRPRSICFRLGSLSFV